VNNNISKTLVQRAVSLLSNASHAIALTGAGISTPSGIPDFRSSGSGLWEKYDPMDVASLAAFRYRPEKFYAWLQPLAVNMVQAQPNPAHIALAELEKAGRLIRVVTQNIDDLHRRAGSKNVIELHGHIREATCVTCYTPQSTEGLIQDFLLSGEIPRCPECNGILKPNAVLYGEQLPFEVVRQAQIEFSRSDLILVIGSSLEVTPAALFPIEPLNTGAQLIIINHMPTYLDERADLIFRQDVAVVLPRLVDEVLNEGRTQ
jgi:NAD-dependent deacetylase